MRFPKLLVLGLLFVGGTFYLRAAAPQKAAPPSRASTLKRVEVAPVEAIREVREMRFSGITRATRRARVSFSIGGRIDERTVEIGDAVSTGQTLARIDDREARNAVRLAEATWVEIAARRAQSERDRQRVARLHGARAATLEELEQADATLDALRAAEDAAAARLQESERRLEEGVLRAPFTGTVSDVLLEPGEHAVAGGPVVILAGSGGIEIEIEVPAPVVHLLTAGDPVKVRLPVVGVETVSGQVRSVARSAAGPGRLFPVVATLDPHPDLLAGMTAEVVLDVVSGDGLAVPLEAVVNPGGRQPAVFRVVGARVEKLHVEVGLLLERRVIVRGALKAGDRVVVGGQLGLLDGDPVQPVASSRAVTGGPREVRG